MRLSKKFVSDYIDIKDIDYKELAEKMVFAGNEYEEVKKLCEVTNLVVGEVTECIDHPNSDHLHICKVDVGNEILDIVCGAPNVKSGIKVIVALTGAELPGITIKAATVAGVISNGMICSLAELGLESKYLKDEDKNGIHVLDSTVIIGSNPLQYLELDDEIIDFELTSNRADLLSLLGMAHEIGAIYDRKVVYPKIELSENKENVNDLYKLDVMTDNCSMYLGKLVKNVIIKESPTFIRARLIASGIRPINNVVDISNYVMLEYGQPLHFFDADRLGNHVIVRMANDNEYIKTLDGQERELSKSDIVIANEEKVVALAGVMGGYNTEVENNTQNIFIEAAIFDSVHIRQTSNNILRSEASNRYEKGIDPNRCEEALKRACYLLDKYAHGEVTSGIISHDKANRDSKIIDISLENIIQVLGMNIDINTVIEIFDRLGFMASLNSNNIIVTVPTRRLDINIKEDLIEEIGRIYGYNHLTSKLPRLDVKRGSYTKKSKLIKELRKRLNALGLDQVITYSLVNEIDKFVNEKNNEIIVLDPLSEDKKYMRQTLIPSLITVMNYNMARNNKDISIFEIGSSYYKKDEYIEETLISGVLTGNYMGNLWQNNNINIDFYLVKGVIENILNFLGLNGRYRIIKEETLKDMHPKMTATILVDNEKVGYLGKVHPLISKKDVYVFEMSLDKLMSKKVRQIKFREISKYPSVKKDLAFVVNKKIESEEIMSIIKKIGGRLLTDIDVFDLYVGDSLKENEKSLAYSLTFENPSKTLNDEEVTEIFNKIINEVETKLAATLRNK